MSKLIVGLDPGHGGDDSGAVSSNKKILEKTVALDIALAVEKILKNNNFEVVLTRRDNKSRPRINERAKFLNSKDCNIVISIHLNSCRFNNSGIGSEVWICSNATKDTIFKAESVLTELTKSGDLTSRGVKFGYPSNKNANFGINRLTNAPSMLLEVGFINNDKDIEYITNHINEVAYSIAKGIGIALGQPLSKDIPKKTEPSKPKTDAKPFDFVIQNLNDKNFKFLCNLKVGTNKNETFIDWLQRQQYRTKIERK